MQLFKKHQREEKQMTTTPIPTPVQKSTVATAVKSSLKSIFENGLTYLEKEGENIAGPELKIVLSSLQGLFKNHEAALEANDDQLNSLKQIFAPPAS